MIEVRIECLCKEYEVEDLGLKFARGDVKWLPKAKADASSELKHAVRIKALDRREVDRGTKSPEEVPPWLRRRGTRPPVQRPRRAAPPPAAPPAPEPAPAPAPKQEGLTQADIRRIAREEFTRALHKSGVSAVSAAAPISGLTREDVADVLREVLGGMATAPTPTTPQSAQKAPVVAHDDGDDEIDDAEPLFIPSDLSKPSEEKADIKIESGETTGDESFAAAKEALKAAPKTKRKRRSRKKKKPVEAPDEEAG